MNPEAAEILDKVPQPNAPAADPQAPQGTAQPHQGDEKIAGKLELLIRREQAALERERFAKMREQELEEKLRRVNGFDEVKQNPKKALEMLGLTYDQLTQSMLADGEVPPQVEIQRLREELEAYKTGQSQEKEKETLEMQRLQKEAEQQKITEFKGEIKQFALDDPSRYELINFEEAHDLIFDVIEGHFERTKDKETGMGKIMTVKEACDKVEEHLEKKFNDSRELNKVKALWGSVPKATQEQLMRKETPNRVGQPVSRPQAKTLSNNLASAIQVKTGRPPEDQRIAQIVQSFRAQKGI